jgi:hypothetical protein
VIFSEPPTVLSYPAVSLRIAPFVPELHGVNRATKAGEYDDTIVHGDEASRRAGRGWVAALFARLAHGCPPEKLLLSISLAQWESCFARAAHDLQLQKLRITPHCLRHGAASSDFASGCRRLDELQRRGRWKGRPLCAATRSALAWPRRSL